MAETPGNDHVAPSWLSLWDKGGKVSFPVRKITDQANLKSLQDHKQWWESLTSCLALGSNCSHVFCKFIASEPVSLVFLFFCAAVLQKDKQQVSMHVPSATENQPQTVICKAGSRGWESKRTQDRKEAQALSTTDILMKFYHVIKGGSACKRGDFKRNWSTEIPTYPALTGFDKEKSLNFGKEASCTVLNSP